MSWLPPAIGYVLIVGAMGVTSKIALRGATWQELMIWAGVAYVATMIVLLATGHSLSLPRGETGLMVGLSVLALPTSIVLFYIALTHGSPAQVVPLTSAYPLVTVVLWLVVLRNPVSWSAAAGAALVVGGTVLLTR